MKKHRINAFYTFLYMYILFCYLFYCTSHLFGMEQHTEISQDTMTFSDIPLDVRKHIISYCLSGSNADVAFQEFMKIYGEESDNKKLTRLSTLWAPLRKKKYQHLNASNIFVLQHIEDVLEKIDRKTVNYYETFNHFSKEKQQKIINYLYTKKYTSTLWEEVEKVAEGRRLHGTSKNELNQAIDTWNTDDPAASFYIQLTKYKYNDNLQRNIYEKQGIGYYYSEGLYSIYEKLELPLIIASKKYNFLKLSFLFKCSINVRYMMLM